MLKSGKHTVTRSVAVFIVARPIMITLIITLIRRDKNFNGVGPVLSRKAKVISSQFDEKHGDKSVQEIKQFVARLPHMLATKQSLARRE